MKKNTTYLRQCFLRMLVEGNYRFSEEELIIWSQNLAIPLEKNGWFCAVAKSEIRDFTGKTILKLRNQCEKVIRELNVLGYAILGDRMDAVVLIIRLDDEEKDRLQIAEAISQRVDKSTRWGVGNPYYKLAQLRNSKEEAYEALEWSSEQVNVSDIRNVGTSQRFAADIQENCRSIIKQFRNGEIDNLHTNLTLLAEQVRSNTIIQPDAPYPTSIRRTMIELLVGILHVASDVGVDVDDQIGHVDPYRKIFELQSTPEIVHWITETAYALNNAIQSRRKRLKEIQLEQAKAYIQEHLSDVELSLSSVSKMLSMSPSYFSAFFMREADVGFKEYVTLERVKLAQNLLRESKESVNIISERCGFLSPSYFISVFKNQTGMTPGTYRKLKN